ncbi:hypothetical protein BWD42_07245 [Sphingobacterium sp. CZ-UAM]|uniref:fimbrillin family protein n=1 Tax=Sphingobacterium sp. CZ-UAM TaxID=1933868 RepID=UPI000986A597|nr:fimbrillin family protein [Sphingobacterium sp. CZ-UAM]OOG19693.1 hypothetical protein BWD42_07245 [Sphingobacterium sp. CZ-UAM]
MQTIKVIFKNIFTLSGKIIIVGLISLFAVSCSKNEETITTAPTAAGETVLTFTVNDITDPRIEKVATTSAARTSEAPRSKLLQFKDGGFDAFLAISQGPITGKSAEQYTSSKNNSQNGLKVAAKMPTTTKYRILLYNEQNTILKKEIEVQSGETPKITVDAGVKYNWYAVSTNEGSAPTVTNGVIDKAALANKDVLYAKGSITPQFGMDNQIPITFRHLNIAYSINLDARGVFGAINPETQIKFPSGDNVIFTGDLNILSGTYSNQTAIPASSLTSNMTTTMSSPKNGDAVVKNAIFYSSQGRSFNSNEFSVTFSPLNIKLYDEPLPKIYDSRTYPFANSFTTEAGNQYNITVELTQSGTIINGNIVWASANLMYNQSGGLYQYYFRTNNAYVDVDPNEFWGWKSSTPDGFQNIIDPCVRVQPLNTWRMPSSAEFEAIRNEFSEQYVEQTPSPGIFGAAASLFVSRAYIAWQWRFGKTASIASEFLLSKPTTLILPFNGKLEYNTFSGQYSSQEQPSTIFAGFGNVGGVGYYWTSDSYTYRKLQFSSTFFNALTSASFVSGSTPANFEASSRFNIRCVRDN